MKALSRFSRWVKGLGRDQAQPKDTPLREFVYLDQVSVYSLLASRVGAVATEFTDTETSSVSDELSSSAGASAALVKGELGTRTQSTQSLGSQVLRKSVIQSTFKDLVEIERESMALRAPGPDARPPRLSGADGLLRILDSQGSEAWVLDPCELRRGQLFEVEVTLEADPMFRMSTIMSTVLSIVRENPALGGFNNPGELEQALTAERLLSALLAGLVPLRAGAVDYHHVSSEGRELLVHRALLEDLPRDGDLVVAPLQVVGVAEESLFWRDLRRVLFTRSRYRVLGRLGRDGVQHTWSPVKLVDVLKEVAPNMARDMDVAGQGFLQAMRAGAAEQANDRQATELMRESLVAYAGALAAHYEKSCTEQELYAHGLPTQGQCESYTTLEAQRAAFGQITDHIRQKLGIPAEPLVAAQLRSQLLAEAGIEVSGAISAPATERASRAEDSPSGEPPPRYLDAEIVAIYW